MRSLSDNDYQKVLSFADQTLTIETDFKKQVLLAFDRIFGFQQSNFYLCNENSSLIEPTMFNTDWYIMDDYLKNYYHSDFLIPEKIGTKLGNRHVLNIFDLVSQEEYEKSEFHSFMSRHGFYHSLVMYLLDGNKPIGFIGFIRSKKDKPFNTSNVMCLEIISRLLSQKLKNYLDYHESKFKTIVDSLSFPNSKLTFKEERVLKLVQKGYTNKEISKELTISTETVKKYLQNLYRKFNVTNRTALCYEVLKQKA